jgi:Methyltransferase domain
MESFSADWLALREPADHEARDRGVAAEVARRLVRHSRTRAIDLASGTGSNVRYLLPRLTHVRHWTLVDHDAALLEVARRSLEPRARAAGIVIETVRADLRDLDALPVADCALVTASALLDLVSARWLAALASQCRAARTDVLFALTYNGRIRCEPHDEYDAHVFDLVNRHQRTDKGFGPALGPDAGTFAEEAFQFGEVVTMTSDWELAAPHAELQRQLIAGWADAARRLAPSATAEIDAWRDRRLAHIVSGRSRVSVGHQDLAAWYEGVEVTLAWPS